MAGSWLNQHWMSWIKKWEKRRLSLMKGRGKWNPSGPSSEFITRKHAISLISSIREKPLAENCMSTVSEKDMQTKTWLQSGRNKVMRTFAACAVSRPEIPTLGLIAFAGSQKASWKWGESLSALTVDAEAALGEIFKNWTLLFGFWKRLIPHQGLLLL